MDLISVRALLINRVGFSRDLEDPAFALSDDNAQSDSGRFFQEEYTFINLKTIHDTCSDKVLGPETFNLYLERLRKSTVIKVLTDVFTIVDAEEELITCNISRFDTAISQRMAIQVGEQILTTTRSNYLEKVSKEFMGGLFFEINGREKDSIVNDNFPTFVGLKSRYGYEIRKLRDFFNQDINTLDVDTIGLGYEDEESKYYWD